MSDDDESDGHLEDLPTLRSQRRFLEVMSLVSTVYYWFDIRINSESSFFGQSVHIGSTRYALLALCIGLVWSAWRYGQHLCRSWQDVKTHLKEDFRAELTRRAHQIIGRYLSRLPAAERKRLFGNELGKPLFRGRAGVWRFDPEQAKRFDVNHKEVASDNPMGPLAGKSHSVISTEFEWLYKNSGNVVVWNFGIGRMRTMWLFTRAAIAAAMKRPAVLDYVTPALMFAFAALSLTLAAFHHTVEL